MEWQSRYESGDTPWDEAAPHSALLDFIAANGPFEGRILIPGCGRGHDVRAISTPANQVIGLDIAPAAIAAADNLPKTANEQYHVADLFNLDPRFHSSFDWAIEHTCFCAIDPALRPKYPGAVAAALKPNARLFAIFYLNPAREHQPPFGVTTAELDNLFSPFFATLREWVPPRTFEDREGRELIRLLRRI